ncbi:MAG: hypothetical protein BGP10_13320 [Rhodanobacter sp. 68-29]|nr:hypothetical protein [Rhodanobacter sp.]ODU92224.1 MAG: hypothetical protein ABT18_13170 [Rhodanobacter sp. SCN 66-43]OJY58305.1 MAG: hypothetical protein BGP10_13320 [Rhodanobacter sp. 68-29]
MNHFFSSLVLAAAVLAAAPASAQDNAHAAAQTAVAAAAQVRGSHQGVYRDLADPRQVAALPWGSLIAYSGQRFEDVGSFQRFGLHLDGLPRDQCVPFITQVAAHFDDVWIADADPKAVGGSVFTDGHLDHSKLVSACHAHEQLGFDLITH